MALSGCTTIFSHVCFVYEKGQSFLGKLFAAWRFILETDFLFFYFACLQTNTALHFLSHYEKPLPVISFSWCLVMSKVVMPENEATKHIYSLPCWIIWCCNCYAATFCPNRLWINFSMGICFCKYKLFQNFSAKMTIFFSFFKTPAVSLCSHTLAYIIFLFT